MNFAVSSQKILKVEIIASTESTARKLNKEDGQQLRTGVALILQKSKPPKSNISKKQHKALTNLKRNKNIVILPADKGNATVVMDRYEYKMKMKKLLDDEYTYKQLPNDPTRKMYNFPTAHTLNCSGHYNAVGACAPVAQCTTITRQFTDIITALPVQID